MPILNWQDALKVSVKLNYKLAKQLSHVLIDVINDANDDLQNVGLYIDSATITDIMNKHGQQFMTQLKHQLSLWNLILDQKQQQQWHHYIEHLQFDSSSKINWNPLFKEVVLDRELINLANIEWAHLDPKYQGESYFEDQLMTSYYYLYRYLEFCWLVNAKLISIMDT